MAEHDDAAAGELTEGAVAVLDPEIDDIEELDDADPGGPDERVDEPAKPKRVRRLAAVLEAEGWEERR